MCLNKSNITKLILFISATSPDLIDNIVIYIYISLVLSVLYYSCDVTDGTYNSVNVSAGDVTFYLI